MKGNKLHLPALFLAFVAGASASAGELASAVTPIGTLLDSRRPILKQDPITTPQPLPAGAHRKILDLRLIFHTKTESKTIQRLMLATERIFSQCSGIDFKLNVIAQVKGPKTRDQEALEESLPPPQKHFFSAVTDRFNLFFQPWMSSRAQRSIDVHFVDHLSPVARQEVKSGKSVSIKYLGKAFKAEHIEALYGDNRSDRAYPPSAVSGNSVILAMDTLRATENRIRYVGKTIDAKGKVTFKEAAREYSSSLLAHELGHILLESQDPSLEYMDHYCPGAKDFCPKANVMSGGGSDDYVFLQPPKFKQVLGYSPLPEIEPEQCEILAQSPLVHE